MDWYKNFLRKNGMIGLFMTIYAVVYVLMIVMLGILGESFSVFFNSVALPVEVSVFLRKPWTLLTWWFVSEPMHLWVVLVDLSLIYTFGNILNAMLGDRRTQGILFLSILVNAILTVVLVNLLPTVDASSSAPVFGLHSLNATLIAAAITIVPNYKFKIIRWEVKLIWVGLFMLFLISLSYKFIFSGMGLSIVSGALLGFILIKVLQSGTDLTKWLQIRLRFKDEEPYPTPSRQSSTDPRIRVVHAQQSPQPKPKKKKISEEERLNFILDRISEVGYPNLSQQEKEDLDRLSGR